MYTAFVLIFYNIVLALVIYGNAEIGKMLGIKGQPLPISVVWPPTGFALAALLILGLKVWPGIFVGNFVYNFLHLYHIDQLYIEQPLLAPFATAVAVAMGSLLEGLLGFYILKRYCSKGYFNTVKDILIFLVPVGLCTTFIASTIGGISLAIYAKINWNIGIDIWSTFWIGDTMGIYVFTPLLVVWTLLKPTVTIREYPWQALVMVVAFIAIALLTFVYQYPIAHFFIPLCIWVPYRFRMHGATLAVFFMTLAFIIPTSVGMGPFNTNFVSDPLALLISFLEIIVASCLILAALVNEREAAWRQVQNHNIDLQQAVEMRQEELKEKNSEIFYQEKRASLGLLTGGIARQIMVPLHRINTFIKTSLETVKVLQGQFGTIEEM